LFHDLKWKVLNADILGISASVERLAQPFSVRAGKFLRAETSAEVVGHS